MTINEFDNDFKYLNTSPDKTIFNYRLFCVLHYKYNMELLDIEKFSQLYNKRSKIAHAGNNQDIASNDLVIAIELISILTEIDKT